MNKEQRTMNKVRKGGLSSFLLALFLLLFLSGCQDPFEPPKPGKPPEGTGWFLLVVDEVHMGRTILPLETLSHFAKYKVDFYDVSSEDLKLSKEIITGEWILVPEGRYYLEVTAFNKDLKKAAWGELKAVTITAERYLTETVIIRPFMDDDTKGTFSWDIKYPDVVEIADMTIWRDGTPLEEQTYYYKGFFKGGPSDEIIEIIKEKDFVELPAGIYHVIFSMVLDNSYSLEHRETLHVYTNLDSLFSNRYRPNLSYTFTENQFTYLIVTNGEDGYEDDDRPIFGSLRRVIYDAKQDEVDPQSYPTSIIIRKDVGTIYLKERLEIDKNLVIEGSGVTIRRDPSWEDFEDNPQLLHIGGGNNDNKVTIRRIRFDGNEVYAPGAAVYNNADLTLESCIFSGNRNNNKATPYVCHGGAIYSDKETTLIVKGCTFYKNIAGGGGGAIAVDADITLLEFAGNLFYENFQNYGTAVFGSGKAITSGGYNAVDEQGTNGWNPVTSGWHPITAPDKIITGVSISPPNFTLSGSEDLLNALLFSPSLLDYPAYDFFGEEISTNAVPGAVQPQDLL